MGHGQRCQAPTQAQHQRPARRQAQHAVVDAVDDRQVMAQHPIGELSQQRAVLVGIAGDRFAGAVGAGGHQGPTCERRQHQLVQSAGRSHHPQPRAAACNVPGQVGKLLALLPRPQQHDRCRRRPPLLPLLGVDVAAALQPARIGQQGEGLVGPALAAPQLGHGSGVAGIHQQLEAADALQGHDPPLAQGGGGGVDCRG